jgi:microcystin degradation protein MlrC
MSYRVLLAGLFHETHTFLEGATSLDDFTIRRGDEFLSAAGDGSPLAGALDVAASCGWTVVPTIDMRATPSAIVEDVVVETFWDGFRSVAEKEIVQGIDGIDLILHGAMVSRSLPDVEGEIISRIRALPGAADIPICGVLDLHGNISRRTMEQTQGLVAYRCCPHTDAHEASADGARLLDRILREGKQPTTVWAQPPVVWPPTGVATADDPMRTLEAMGREIEVANPEIAVVNVFAGFSFADMPETGVSFSAVTFGDPEVARAHLKRLCDYTVEHREAGNVIPPQLEEMLPAVIEHIKRGETPVILVEPADNIGGGAPGDATTLLRAFVGGDIAESVVIINDPQTVSQLGKLVPGDRTMVAVGGRGSQLAEGPVELEVELFSVSDGQFELEDHHSHLASMNGIQIDMGPCAVVRHGGVTILLTSHKTPPFDLGQLRSQGIDPERCSVIGVKAAVAHRQGYDPITKATYTVATPGPCSSDASTFPFKTIRRPVFPLDEI